MIKKAFALLLAHSLSVSASAQAVGALTRPGRVGLFPSTDFRVSKGADCGGGCRAPKEALWYFGDSEIATLQPGVPRDPAHPGLVWLGAPEVSANARVDWDKRTITHADGSVSPLDLAPKYRMNKSYFNDESGRFFAPRSVQVRGQTGPDGKFTARTIWPEDFAMAFDDERMRLDPLKPGEKIETLVGGYAGGPGAKLETRLLWEKNPGAGRQWENKPVLGLMLNGAQGDDHEALGGHFGMVSGRFGPQGQWDDWIVTNFYDLDQVSEKDILAAETPMDNYLFDLNRGQQYYRPSYMLVAVLKDERAAKAMQASATEKLRKFYTHEVLYEESKANCTGLTMDALREAGWSIPGWGSTGPVLGALGAAYMWWTDGRRAARGMWNKLNEEHTRLLPRAAFEAGLEDMLALAQGNSGRELSQVERQLSEDVEAVIMVRIPQVPSSRRFGAAPVRSPNEYRQRVPSDRSQWETIKLPKRAFPPPSAPAEERERPRPPTPPYRPAPVRLPNMTIGVP